MNLADMMEGLRRSAKENTKFYGITLTQAEIAPILAEYDQLIKTTKILWWGIIVSALIWAIGQFFSSGWMTFAIGGLVAVVGFALYAGGYWLHKRYKR
jgi:hypothetical protein